MIKGQSITSNAGRSISRHGHSLLLITETNRRPQRESRKPQLFGLPIALPTIRAVCDPDRPHARPNAFPRLKRPQYLEENPEGPPPFPPGAAYYCDSIDCLRALVRCHYKHNWKSALLCMCMYRYKSPPRTHNFNGLRTNDACLMPGCNSLLR